MSVCECICVSVIGSFSLSQALSDYLRFSDIFTIYHVSAQYPRHVCHCDAGGGAAHAVPGAPGAGVPAAPSH